jgi:hypothetical protein
MREEWTEWDALRVSQLLAKGTHRSDSEQAELDELCAKAERVVGAEQASQPQVDQANDVAADLHAWWIDTAEAEVGPLIDKMFEYGGAGRAKDLIDIGNDLDEIRHGEGVSDAEAAELGIYFYIRGKMSRWTAAVQEGRAVSDDTLLDIGVYVRMVQRIRAVGGWPV